MLEPDRNVGVLARYKCRVRRHRYCVFFTPELLLKLLTQRGLTPQAAEAPCS
jgi:hypothetical protein